MDNGMSFINKDWRNLAKALSFKNIQSSTRNPRANGCIENVHNFLKRTMIKIRYGNESIKWHEAIYNLFIDDNDRSLLKYWYRWNKKGIHFDWHLYKKAFVNLHKCTKVAKYRNF